MGDTVAVDGTEAKMMLVWIPRYEYKIEGQYGKYIIGLLGTEDLPGEIEVNFIGKGTTTSTEGYHIHPAFTFGEQELSGIWVGKFELSHTELSSLSSYTYNNYLRCSTTTCTSAAGLRVLPNKQSLRYNNLSNFFYAIRSIENTSSFGLSNMDIHMMKNSEWGAVAYLSQSKYGKYGNKDYARVMREVYQNKSSSYITGSSNGTPSQEESYTQCTYNQKTGSDSHQDQKNCGPGASTTGNIYGVYDMSGGAEEYVMGAYGTESDGIYSGYSTTIGSGFNGKTGYDNGTVTNGVILPDPKYYDIYANATNVPSNDGSLSCKNGNEYGICYGHAISETKYWYGDSASMVFSSYPWFVRGAAYFHETTAGVFSTSHIYGDSFTYISTRVVGFGK